VIVGKEQRTCVSLCSVTVSMSKPKFMLITEVKVNLPHALRHEGVWGSRSIDPLFPCFW
jgi:hypothetical protein